MTKEQRTERIRILTRELRALLAEDAPKRPMTFLTAADIPAWVAEGLRDAVRRKMAEDGPVRTN